MRHKAEALDDMGHCALEELLAEGVRGLHDQLLDVSLLSPVLGKLGYAAAHNLSFIMNTILVHDLHQAVLIPRPRLLSICISTAQSDSTTPSLHAGKLHDAFGALLHRPTL